jgi:hypothetical protein
MRTKGSAEMRKIVMVELTALAVLGGRAQAYTPAQKAMIEQAKRDGAKASEIVSNIQQRALGAAALQGLLGDVETIVRQPDYKPVRLSRLDRILIRFGLRDKPVKMLEIMESARLMSFPTPLILDTRLPERLPKDADTTAVALRKIEVLGKYAARYRSCAGRLEEYLKATSFPPLADLGERFGDCLTDGEMFGG